MKRLSKKQRKRLLIRLRILERKIKKITIRNRRCRILKHSQITLKKARAVCVCAPKCFDLFERSRKRELMLFFDELRKVVLRGETKVVIDCSKTERFIAAGTLLFYAELDRLVMLTGGSVIFRIRPPYKRPREDAVLSQLGFYRLCGSERTVKSWSKNVIDWRVAHGKKVDNSKCAPALEHIVEGRLAEPLIDGLFRGLGEAMTNTVHHAYIEMRDDGLYYNQKTQDWWMFSRADNGKLYVAFCDLGIGIRRSLPRQKPNIFQRLKRFGRTDSDADAIQYAVEDAVTRTGVKGRGRGLGNILQAVSESDGGTVDVISNKGCYSKRAGHPARAYNCKYDILGTLVVWSVPLDGVKSYGE